MIDVIKQMVEALEWCYGGKPVDTAEAIKAGKKLIAELESQELKQVTVKDFVHIVESKEDLIGRPVYFAQWPNGNARPPQRTWVELTEEDLKLLSAEWRIVYGAWMDDFAKEIEAKLKEKNT